MKYTLAFLLLVCSVSIQAQTSFKQEFLSLPLEEVSYPQEITMQNETPGELLSKAGFRMMTGAIVPLLAGAAAGGLFYATGEPIAPAVIGVGGLAGGSILMFSGFKLIRDAGEQMKSNDTSNQEEDL
jgi:hypothetical protein